jgi:methionyl-tRNA formyltransferase
LAHGTVTAQPQSGATSYAGRIEKEHGLIDWSLPAVAVHNHARAVTPWPGATTRLAGEALVVKRTRVADPDGPATEAPFAGAPGQVLAVSGPALRVACGGGAVDLLELRPAGRPTMSGGDFARGRRLSPGARFDGGADGSR